LAKDRLFPQWNQIKELRVKSEGSDGLLGFGLSGFLVAEPGGAGDFKCGLFSATSRHLGSDVESPHISAGVLSLGN
jgi:hypothetical protein